MLVQHYKSLSNKVENSLDLDPLTFRAIGIIFIAIAYKLNKAKRTYVYCANESS